MIQQYRDAFNKAFTEEKYKAFLEDVYEDAGYKVEFRIAESPVFFPEKLKERLKEACNDIIKVIKRPDFKQITERSVPKEVYVPNEDSKSLFLTFDFAVCKDENGELTPRLIEMQGFPSLYCFQLFISEKYRSHFNIPDNLTNLFGGLHPDEYIEIVRDAIVDKHNPENVILLEIEPEKQKTKVDFTMTERYLGVRAVCLTKIIKEGRKLFYEHEGRKIPIHRIYNRVIFDELTRKPDLKFNFDFREEVDVEWAGHPNWFFRISKFTLPYIESQYVPETKFLSDVKEYPKDLENYVLKPLFSFAGVGVKFDVTLADLEAVPAEERANFVLQKKVQYAEIIPTMDIPAKGEIRMLYIWDNDEPILVNNLVRLSKGKMMGVDFNKDKTWVGGSVGFFEEEAKA